MNLNRVVLAGNLARDPDLRFLPSGTAKATLTLAVSRPPDKQGERVTDFLTVIAWRKHAEVLSEHARKGDPLILEGRLQARDFTTEDGQKRHVVEVLLTDFSFVGNGRDRGDQNEENGEREEAPVPKKAPHVSRETSGARAGRANAAARRPPPPAPASRARERRDRLEAPAVPGLRGGPLDGSRRGPTEGDARCVTRYPAFILERRHHPGARGVGTLSRFSRWGAGTTTARPSVAGPRTGSAPRRKKAAPPLLPASTQ